MRSCSAAPTAAAFPGTMPRSPGLAVSNGLPAARLRRRRTTTTRGRGMQDRQAPVLATNGRRDSRSPPITRRPALLASLPARSSGPLERTHLLNPPLALAHLFIPGDAGRRVPPSRPPGRSPVSSRLIVAGPHSREPWVAAWRHRRRPRPNGDQPPSSAGRWPRDDLGGLTVGAAERRQRAEARRTVRTRPLLAGGSSWEPPQGSSAYLHYLMRTRTISLWRQRSPGACRCCSTSG